MRGTKNQNEKQKKYQKGEFEKTKLKPEKRVSNKR